MIEGYGGQRFRIPLGEGGLYTDGSTNDIPLNSLIYANNVVARNGVIEAVNGAIKYNQTALVSPVVAAYEYFPTPSQPRMIVVTADGRVYRFISGYVLPTEITPVGSILTTGNTNSSNQLTNLAIVSGVAYGMRVNGSGIPKGTTVAGVSGSTVTLSKPAISSASSLQISFIPASSVPASLTVTNDKQVHIVEGGQETAGNPKKLFIFSGNDPIQVISGDSLNRTNLNLPALDWISNTGAGPFLGNDLATVYKTSSQPLFGLVYRTRLFVLGSGDNTHRVYVSRQISQEDFSTNDSGDQPVFFNVYPGEQDGFASMFVFQGRLFCFKAPRGVYYLNDTATNAQLNSDSTSWYFKKLNDSFGIASPHSAINVLSDALIANNAGSVTSMQAAFQLGDVKMGDILTTLRCDQFVRGVMNPTGNTHRWSLYYEDQKKAFFAYQGAGAIQNNYVLEVDVSQAQPKVFLHDAFQANCFATQRDVTGVPRPMYGANDGFLYIMDRPDKTVAGTGYVSTFQTTHTESSLDQNKLYDFLELAFEPTGNWNLSVDVIIDGKFIETLSFPLYSDSTLDKLKLGQGRVFGRMSRTFLRPLRGSGKRISFKCYNQGTGQNFKVTALTVYFRVAGDGQKAQSA